MGFHRHQFAVTTLLKIAALVHGGFKVSGALPDENLLAAPSLRFQQFLGHGQVHHQRLGADHMLTRFQRHDDMLGMKLVGCVNADHVNAFIPQHLLIIGAVTGKVKLLRSLSAQLLVQVADGAQLPQPAALHGRDDAASLPQSEHTNAQLLVRFVHVDCSLP